MLLWLSRSTRDRAALAVCALAVLAWLALSFPLPALEARVRGGKLAAATEVRDATRAALDQMRAGGNAVDAAVAAALVAGVTSPSSSGLGGGGFVMLWQAESARAWVLDFRETAPAALDPAAFERRPLPESERGHLVGVPGELRGLFALHRRAGSRAWSDVVRPAVRAAAQGFSVGPHLGAMLKFSASSVTDPELRSVFYPKGRPAAFSALVKNPKLAATLERIAAEGPPALYQGGVAADIVDAIRRVGGPMTLEDVERYAPVERDPLRVEFEGYTVYTMPLPSAGGLMLVQTLKLFTAAELEKLRFGSGAYQHMVAEALRAAIADRMRYLGDPAFQPVAMDRLLSDARMAARRRSIALDRTHAIPRFGLEEHGTHHLVTADAAGNVVSLTTTVNRAFGAKLVAPQSGIVLNDELNDFTQRSAVAPLGMTQSPNRPRPGARPVSSMTPTIVTRGGRAVLALGGSGGPAIATNVTQVALSSLVFDHAPDQAVREPRFYVPDSGAFMLLEDGASAALFADLRRRGEIVKTMPFKGTAVQIIGRLNDRWLPAADPRKHGAALAE